MLQPWRVPTAKAAFPCLLSPDSRSSAARLELQGRQAGLEQALARRPAKSIWRRASYPPARYPYRNSIRLSPPVPGTNRQNRSPPLPELAARLYGFLPICLPFHAPRSRHGCQTVRYNRQYRAYPPYRLLSTVSVSLASSKSGSTATSPSCSLSMT